MIDCIKVYSTYYIYTEPTLKKTYFLLGINKSQLNSLVYFLIHL